MATVANAAMPPVEIKIERYGQEHFLIRANGKILVHGLEGKNEVFEFVSHVSLGVEAAGRRVNVVGREEVYNHERASIHSPATDR